jgi:hypothetical protein
MRTKPNDSKVNASTSAEAAVIFRFFFPRYYPIKSYTQKIFEPKTQGFLFMRERLSGQMGRQRSGSRVNTPDNSQFMYSVDIVDINDINLVVHVVLKEGKGGLDVFMIINNKDNDYLLEKNFNRLEC